MREELREAAEHFVISKCREAYRHLLMTGPFQTTSEVQPARNASLNAPDDATTNKRQATLHKETEIIKDRERLCVMGALMHQINANNFIVTVAVVDKLGDLVAYKDFMRLLPPRSRKQPPGVSAGSALASGVGNPSASDFPPSSTLGGNGRMDNSLQGPGANTAGAVSMGGLPLTEEQREHE